MRNKLFYILTFSVIFAGCKQNTDSFPHDAADLTVLKVQGCALLPQFSSAETNYEAVAFYEIDTANIYAEAKYSGAVLKINPGKTINVSGYINRKAEIIVENCGIKKTYTVNIVNNKAVLNSPNLKSLTVMHGSRKIELSPPFSPAITFYTSHIPFSFSENIELFFESEDKEASVSIIKNPDTLKAEAGSMQTFSITVLSKDRNIKKTYTVACIRNVFSENTKIKIVKVYGFKAALRENIFYSEVPLDDEESIILNNITVEAEDSAAVVSVSPDGAGVFEKNDGAEKTYNIKVTSEKGSEKIYKLILRRSSSAGVKISSVSVLGVIAEKEQYDGNIGYRCFVPYGTENAEIIRGIKVFFEGRNYNYYIRRKDSEPLGLIAGSRKDYSICVISSDGLSVLEYPLTVIRDFKTGKADRKIVDVLKTEISFTGEKPSWLNPAAQNAQEFYGSFLPNEQVTISPYSIGACEITYQFWEEVYTWGVENGYHFENKGKKGSFDKGSERQPVTDVSWRDVIVWCNAYSEMRGKIPVYYSDAQMKRPLKTSVQSYEFSQKVLETDGSIDKPYINKSADGFRLPTETEWEFAARGGSVNGLDWNFRYSGSNDLQDVGVHFAHDDKNKITAEAASKYSNTLNVYDMTGNVFEWCADIVTANNVSCRALRGGAYYCAEEALLITWRGYFEPYRKYTNRGFRIAKNYQN